MSRDLVVSLGQSLVERGLTLCTAESCTGGLLADTLTDVPGSSRYYLGGVVAYSNEVKRAVLGVPASYLTVFGAVSAPVALALARSARRLIGADIALSTTGIAGPSGGTAGKPVGLVYIAIVAPGYASCQRLVWPYGRRGNKVASVSAALALALRCVAGRPS
jgi:PncC family amidohydrolase